MTTLAAALAADDRRAVQIEIDNVLAAQDPAAGTKERMEALRQWIEDQDGVVSVEVSPDLLDTDPSVQEVFIRLESDPDTRKSIGVVLDPRGLRFDIQ